jgi:putative ABC transport system substrate-binding protein
MLDKQRREFIILAGAAGLLVAAKASRARGQQPGMPVVGFLRDSTAAGSEFMVNGLRKGLAEAGFIEGRNVTIEYAWTERPERAVVGARGRIGGPAPARHR